MWVWLKSIVHEGMNHISNVKVHFQDSKWKCKYQNINILWYIDRYYNTDWQFEMFKRGKKMDMILGLSVNLNLVSLFSVTYVVGTHWNSS